MDDPRNELNPVDLRILAALSSHTPMTTRAVANAAKYPTSLVRKRLEAMEHRGHVEKTQTGNDWRPAMWVKI